MIITVVSFRTYIMIILAVILFWFFLPTILQTTHSIEIACPSDFVSEFGRYVTENAKNAASTNYVFTMNTYDVTFGGYGFYFYVNPGSISIGCQHGFRTGENVNYYYCDYIPPANAISDLYFFKRGVDSSGRILPETKLIVTDIILDSNLKFLDVACRRL